MSLRDKRKPLILKSVVLVAAGQGFEPRQTESESVVLPLHNPAIQASPFGDYYSISNQLINVKHFFRFFPFFLSPSGIR